MNILLYSWSSTGQKNLSEEFLKMGHNVDQVSIRYKDFDNDPEFTEALTNVMNKKKYDVVFSYNYFPIISNVCNTMEVKYIGWVWDSPLLTLYSKTIYNSCNYIFIFDKALYNDLKSKEINQVYYLPLGTNVDNLDQIKTDDSDDKKYGSEISFVGNLYTEKNFYDQINYLPDYLKGYLEGIMKAQLKIFGYNFLEELLTDDIMKEIRKYVKFDLGSDYFASDAKVFSNLFLGQKVTALERVKVLDMLSKRYPIQLYTDSETKNLLPMIRNNGYIDYDKVMPKVFKLSKINLNITLRNIQTGIPLRIFDIMGAGGFLITNYQEELLDYFEPGSDFIYYEDWDDLINKIDYFLVHEEERKQIAKNGYRKVKEQHSIRQRLEDMFHRVFKSMVK